MIDKITNINNSSKTFMAEPYKKGVNYKKKYHYYQSPHTI